MILNSWVHLFVYLIVCLFVSVGSFLKVWRSIPIGNKLHAFYQPVWTLWASSLVMNIDSGLETNSQLPMPCSFSNTTTYFWKLHGTHEQPFRKWFCINKLIPFSPFMQVRGWHSRTELRPVSSDTRSRPTWVSRLKPCLKEPALLCLSF